MRRWSTDNKASPYLQRFRVQWCAHGVFLFLLAAGGIFAFQRQGGVAVAVVATVVVGGVGDVAFGGKIVAFAVSCNGFLEGTHGRVAGVVAGDVQGGQGGVLFHGVGQGAATEFAWTKGKGTERVEGWQGVD